MVPEQSIETSRFIRLVRKAWPEDRGILFLDPILDQIGEEAPSAARLLGNWSTALDQLRRLAPKIKAAVDGRAVAVFRDDWARTGAGQEGGRAWPDRPAKGGAA